MELIYYPKCSTCMKALKHLESKNLSFKKRHIVEQTPTAQEFQQWIEQYGQGIKPFFNTSGQVYRAMNLKDKINDLGISQIYYDYRNRTYINIAEEWCRNHHVPYRRNRVNYKL